MSASLGKHTGHAAAATTAPALLSFSSGSFSSGVPVEPFAHQAVDLHGGLRGRRHDCIVAAARGPRERVPVSGGRVLDLRQRLARHDEERRQALRRLEHDMQARAAIYGTKLHVAHAAERRLEARAGGAYELAQPPWIAGS